MEAFGPLFVRFKTPHGPAVLISSTACGVWLLEKREPDYYELAKVIRDTHIVGQTLKDDVVGIAIQPDRSQ